MEEESGLSGPPRGGVVSLDLELGTLATAIQGAGMLADLQARRELPDTKMERDAPACILAVLSLVTERIGQLRRVVRNEENPGNLWARHNAVEDPETCGEYPGDIVLFSWGSHRLPLVMWGDRGKAREVAPASSEVSQDESPREPAPSAPASNDPKKKNG